MGFVSINPATGEVVKSVAFQSDAEIDAALAQAHAAFLTYSQLPVAERARMLNTAASVLDSESPDVARILTTEMGKTFAAARGEVAKCVLGLRWFAEHGPKMLESEMVVTGASQSYVRYDPIGAVLAIMPWNFPLWQVIRFAAPTLIAGNVGLLKHAPNVPETAAYLEGLFRRSGYPAGIFTSLYCDVDAIARVISDDRVAAVTLTGSERAGRSVAAAAGAAVKKCVLELGGSDPFIVLSSADIEKAVRVGVTARTQNNGQSCIAGKRFIIEDSIYDEFAQKFSDAMASLVVGDPFDPATDVGPLVSETQRNQIASQVNDAVEKGAKLHCGGAIPSGPGWYYPPTVLSEITPAMRVYKEEVFGPVATLWRAKDEDDAIAIANDTPFGLGASVWSGDDAQINRLIPRLEVGQVFVNAMVASTPELPFGGVKNSGIGRELSVHGLREFVNAKAVWVA
jgi:succinate-semialdehyde dehydrogenase/glutarate-semialdehyde dehydrogenase